MFLCSYVHRVILVVIIYSISTQSLGCLGELWYSKTTVLVTLNKLLLAIQVVSLSSWHFSPCFHWLVPYLSKIPLFYIAQCCMGNYGIPKPSPFSILIMYFHRLNWGSTSYLAYYLTCFEVWNCIPSPIPIS